MLHQDYYVREKLRELGREQLTLLSRRTNRTNTATLGAPVIGTAVRGTGRLLRRLGDGLESWASPAGTEGERRLRAERRLG